jgi:hypothetical protein
LSRGISAVRHSTYEGGGYPVSLVHELAGRFHVLPGAAAESGRPSYRRLRCKAMNRDWSPYEIPDL